MTTFVLAILTAVLTAVVVYLAKDGAVVDKGTCNAEDYELADKIAKNL